MYDAIDFTIKFVNHLEVFMVIPHKYNSPSKKQNIRLFSEASLP